MKIARSQGLAGVTMRAVAAELGVTQSAVSHQMRQLTEVIGERLFALHGRGIALTASGEQLLSFDRHFEAVDGLLWSHLDGE